MIPLPNVYDLLEENDELAAENISMKIGIAYVKKLHKDFIDCLVELLEADASDEMKVAGMMVVLHNHLEELGLEEEE